MYWDSSIDLNNNTITNVLHKLSIAIQKLGRDGIKPIIPRPDWEYSDMCWGISRERQLICPMLIERRYYYYYYT
jgi:hypothetical protein